MKRINISVDLEDNKIFEESVIEAIKAEGRQLAREVMEKSLKEEIDRIAEKWTEDRSYFGYAGKVEREMNRRIKEAIDSIEINKEVLEKRVEKLDVDGIAVDMISKRVRESGIKYFDLMEFIENTVEKCVKRDMPTKLIGLLSDKLDSDSIDD